MTKKYCPPININVSLNAGRRDAICLHAKYLLHEGETRALTPIIRPFVFIQLLTRRVPAAEA